MGGISRRKGAGEERRIVNLLKSLGLKARRTAPLQTFAENDAPDIEIQGGKYAAEAKLRKDGEGFKTIYKWFTDDVDWLYIRMGGEKGLVVVREELFHEWLLEREQNETN